MNSIFKVESGIPIPNYQINVRRLYVYPFRDMKPGDSFFVTPEQADEPSVRAAASMENRKVGAKVFVARKQPGGMRVWMVEPPVEGRT